MDYPSIPSIASTPSTMQLINGTNHNDLLNVSNTNADESQVFYPNATYYFNGENIAIPSAQTIQEQGATEKKTYRKITPSSKSTLAFLTRNNIDVLKGGLKAIFHSILRPKTSLTESNNRCTEYTVIDMAIAYDSTYCNALNGKENAEAEIQSIVSVVSDKYQQQGLCMQVEISYLEGYCDSNLDPYNDILKKDEGVQKSLNDFKDYWNLNRAEVNRTVAHLFTAYHMSSTTVGIGFLGVACNKKYAYSVNEVTWSDNLDLRAGLVAHELGHNMGAEHVENTGCGKNVMESTINNGKSGFREVSRASIGGYSEKVTCMRTVPAT